MGQAGTEPTAPNVISSNELREPADSRAAHSAAQVASGAVTDAHNQDLDRLIDRWATLPAEVRGDILRRAGLEAGR